MKVIPHGMTIRQALKAGLLGRVEDPAYLSYVRKKRCCCGCGEWAQIAHHPIDVGYGGVGTKCPDYWAIPLTYTCHTVLHKDVGAWEEKHGHQLEHSVLTMTEYILERME